MGTAEIDHRLDREQHAGPKYHALAVATDMDDVGLVMEQAAQPMTAEIADHAHMLGFDEGLDGGPDVACGAAGPDRRNSAHHSLVGDVDEPLCAARNFADRVHAARIAMPAVHDQRHVHVDDIA